MSRQNKVNPDHYTLAGRLSPDDLARERRKQINSGLGRARKNRPLPPWMLHAEAPVDAAASVVESPSEERPTPRSPAAAPSDDDVRPSRGEAERPTKSTRKRAAKTSVASKRPARPSVAKKGGSKRTAAKKGAARPARPSARKSAGARKTRAAKSTRAPSKRAVTAARRTSRKR